MLRLTSPRHISDLTDGRRRSNAPNAQKAAIRRQRCEKWQQAGFDPVRTFRLVWRAEEIAKKRSKGYGRVAPEADTTFRLCS